jgi:hypothetical protein
MAKLTKREQEQLARLMAKQGYGAQAPATEQPDVPEPDGPDVAAMAETYANLNREQRRELDNKMGDVEADGTFAVGRRTFRLNFDGTDLQGLWVRAHSLPIGTLLELLAMAGEVEHGVATQKMNAEQLKVVTDLFDGFSAALLGWNLTNKVLDNDGNDTGGRVRVPPTTEGMLGQDTDLVMPIIMAWIEAASGVAKDLGKGSSSGGTLPGGSMPMETRSPSPPS